MRLCEHILRKCRSAVRVLPGLVTVCCVSCINEYPDGRTEAGAPLPQGTVLALKVSLTDQAGFASTDGGDLPDIEKMRDLRVVITSKDAEGRECVEFNRYLDFSDASEKWRYKYGYVDDDRLMFKLTDTNPEKHVYLFANCEPLFTAEKIDHPDPEKGIYGDVGANKDKKLLAATAYIERLRGLTYTNAQLQEWVKPADGSAPNGIPMSAEYDITVVPGNTGIVDTYVLDAYILRAADKITFEYENKRTRYPIFVQNWGLQSVADKAFLLPQVDDAEANRRLVQGFDNWIGWYAEHSGTQSGAGGSHDNELQFTVPSDVSCVEYNGRGYKYSGSYAQDTYCDESGEITEEMYNGAVREEVSGLMLPGYDYDEQESTTVEDGTVYYFPETRFIPDASGRQQYTLYFNTLEYSSTGQETGGAWKYYVAVGSYNAVLSKVTTLFRNTHVKIHATFQEGDQVTLNVSVMNWKELGPYTGQLDYEQGDSE